MSDVVTQNEVLFDSRETCVVHFRSGGKRQCRIKFPSDKQWIERSSQFKLKQTDLGRDKSINELDPIEKFDARLFELLVEDNAEDYDEYDRSNVIDRLAYAEVIESKQEEEDQVSITLEVYGTTSTGERRKVKIWLREPRRKDLVEYGRVAMKVVNVRKGKEIRVAIEPSMRLFEKYFVRAEGYEPGAPIPAIHQDAAIIELNRLMGEV